MFGVGLMLICFGFVWVGVVFALGWCWFALPSLPDCLPCWPTVW